MQLHAVASESDHNFSRNAFAIVVADDLYDNRRYRLPFIYLSLKMNGKSVGLAVARWQPQEENNQMICNYCTTPMKWMCTSKFALMELCGRATHWTVDDWCARTIKINHELWIYLIFFEKFNKFLLFFSACSRGAAKRNATICTSTASQSSTSSRPHNECEPIYFTRWLRRARRKKNHWMRTEGNGRINETERK